MSIFNGHRNRYTPEGKAHREAESATAWGSFGIGLIVDCCRELFRGKTDDEEWSSFVFAKLGLLVLIAIGVGVLAFALFLLYVKIRWH